MPEPVGDDWCRLSTRWKLEPTVAKMLVGLDQWAKINLARKGYPWPGIFIISGFRSKRRQQEVNPEAPNSLHTRCPSLAVDLRIGNLNVGMDKDQVWFWLGAQWKMLGGRWGGDFHDEFGQLRTDELNHFDYPVFT